MTDAKHTPGPWSVTYKRGTTNITTADGQDIMCDETYYPWVPENDADWKLIAAAPDMYQALIEARELIQGDKVGKEWKRACAEFLKASKPAIAKAEGRDT